MLVAREFKADGAQALLPDVIGVGEQPTRDGALGSLLFAQLGEGKA